MKRFYSVFSAAAAALAAAGAAACGLAAALRRPRVLTLSASAAQGRENETGAVKRSGRAGRGRISLFFPVTAAGTGRGMV